MGEVVAVAADQAARVSVSDVIPERLDHVVVTRLATSRNEQSPRALAGTLRALAPSSFTDATWLSAIERAAERIRAAGAVDDRLRPLKTSRAFNRLGVPTGAKWKAIYERWLPGLGLGVAAADMLTHERLRGHDIWAAAVIARVRGLWQEGAPPSPPRLCDALVWRTLDLAGPPKITPPQVRGYVLGQILGQSGASPAQLLHYLAAREVGAVRSDLRGLREALSRRWMVGLELTKRTISARPLSLPEFAAAVNKAAAQATHGVFGTRNVFIAPLWRAVLGHPGFSAVSLDEFKQQLVAANRMGLLKLARADLVAAMDPRDVAESETSHLEARFHFVERKETP